MRQIFALGNMAIPTSSSRERLDLEKEIEPTLRAAYEAPMSRKEAIARCALPLIAGLLFSVVYLSIPMHGNCREDHTLDFGRLLISQTGLLTFVIAPYILWQMVGLLPIVTANGQCLNPLGGTMLFVTFALPGVIVGCRYAGYDSWAVWLIPGYGAGLMNFFLIALYYGIVIIDQKAGSFTTKAPSLCRFQAIENKLRTCQFMEEQQAHLDWVGEKYAMAPEAIQEAASIQAEGKGPRLLVHPTVQMFWAVVFFLISETTYGLLVRLVKVVRSQKQVGLGMFLLFNVASYIMKAVLKASGIKCDFGKAGTPFSGYYTGYITGMYFHYFFYRAIFETIQDWPYFLLLQSIHIALEWIWHCGRATDSYYHAIRKVSSWMPWFVQDMFLQFFLSRQPNVSSRDWKCFMALETALQGFGVVLTICVYGFGTTWLRYGYNRSAMSEAVTKQTEAEFQVFLLQMFIQLVTEVINVILMELWFRRKLGRVGALRRLPLLFRDNQFLLFFCMVGGCKSTSVWFGFLSQTFCSLK